MTSYNVTSGQTSNGLSLGTNDSLTVFAGGTVNNTYDAGANISISGGVENRTTLNGGFETLYAGAMTSGTMVGSNGFEIISGGIASGTAISSGGFQIISGGTASGTAISSGGYQIISGGMANGAVVNSGGFQIVSAGQAVSTTINNFGSEIVRGGVISGTIVSSGGSDAIYSGASSNDYIANGGREYVYGGLANGTLVDAGGVQLVYSGAAISGTVLIGASSSGTAAGAVFVQSGGTATATRVLGGTLGIYGGSASGTVVSGGVVGVSSGSLVQGTTVTSGGGYAGFLTVNSGGITNSSMINSGGVLRVYGGAALSNTTFSGGTEIVDLGYTVSGLQVRSGGLQTLVVSGGGSAIATTVFSGGSEVISGNGTAAMGGTASGTVLSGGSLELTSGAIYNGAVTFAGSATLLLDVGATTSSTSITGFGAGDVIDVAGGGTAMASFNYTTDVLTLTSSSGAATTLQFNGNYHGEVFSAAADGANGTNVTVSSQSPTVSITGISGGTNVVDHIISGTVGADDGGSSITILNGSTALGTATSDANGNWSLPFVYAGDGSSYMYSLTATDTNTTGTGTSSATSLALNFVPNESSFGTISHDTSHPGGQVYALYEGLLGRAPDAQGAEGWVASLNGGTSVAQVAQAFLNSPEGQQTFPSSGSNKSFVDTLYQKVLGRTADTGGEQAWVNNLNAGESRADVADAFVFSNEHVSQLQPALNAGIFVADANTSAVARLYYGLLGRAPDAGGLSGNTQAVNGGASIQTVAQSFINSNEYQSQYANLTNDQFVTALYQNALGRSPDQGGLQAWDNQLAAGSSRASVAASIIQSQEGQNHLAGKIETGFHFA